MLVSEVMSTDVVSCTREADLADLVGLMLEHDVGSVVVLDGEAIDGIVSESDALRAAHRRAVPLEDIQVAELIDEAGEIVTVQRDAPIRVAVDRMTEHEVKKLPVIDDFDLVGIVTLTDLVYHITDFQEEAEALAFAHYRWQS